jgi:hypothetical protein
VARADLDAAHGERRVSGVRVGGLPLSPCAHPSLAECGRVGPRRSRARVSRANTVRRARGGVPARRRVPRSRIRGRHGARAAS